MCSIALVGVDGAGKTTQARKLAESAPAFFRYLYMGVNPDSANRELPSSRLLQRLKRRPSGPWYRLRSFLNSHPRIRRVKSACRVLNLMAEESYRQLVSWSYQVQGFVVLYDRHFVFDFAATTDTSLAARLHLWYLQRLYPRPDLVLFLDAPSQVLYRRKPEAPVEFLEARRRAILELARETKHFVRVDATQPPEAVFSQLRQHVLEFLRCHSNRTVQDRQLET